MILLREIEDRDLDALERFAQIPGFINLTNDKDALSSKIQRSKASFAGKLKDKNEGKYLFVAEDALSKRVLGTSMIAAEHGNLESPHFYFEVGSEEKFSETISTGFIHGTLKLKYDTNGPSEIGGLVLDPEYRNSEARLGRQISFVRFLYLGLHRDSFKRMLLAELLPPLNKKGQSPLWEAIGRRFTNMDYWEADQLCQNSKEFIFSLFPSGKIYTTFLTAEARNAIGKVGKETEPVLHMLEKIGFEYLQQIDPFDGGPHLWANVDDILPIQKIGNYRYTRVRPPGSDEGGLAGLVCAAEQKPGQFRAVAVKAVFLPDPAGATGLDQRLLAVTGDAIEFERVLDLSEGAPVVFMPYY